MSTSAPVNQNIEAAYASTRRLLNWQTILTYLAAVVIFIVGVRLRLQDLGLPFDRDGYDEGVYWQSLRAMASGHSLYHQIFYSQPPFFLLSVFPTYMLAGQTLWSARLGVVVMSLLGLVGAFLLGKALSGHIGAVVAMLLLVADPLYLAQSQTIQAEAASAGLSLLAVGLAYLWWEHPQGLAGICYAILAGATLSLSILSKLFGVALLVPIGLLFLAQLWRIFRQPADKRFGSSFSLIAGLAAFIIVTAALILPFLGSRHELIQGVVTFHSDAGKFFKDTVPNNLAFMGHLLTSVTASAAIFGTTVALIRRDWRVVPLITWFLATLYLLLQQAPLFHHHFVVLIPPMISLAIMGIGPIKLSKKIPDILINVATTITLCVLLFAAVENFQGEQRYYTSERQLAATATRLDDHVVTDLQNQTQPGQLVITDAQFLAGLADRSTPAQLVDTSIVRIVTNNVTAQQLIDVAAQPDVHGVLFYTGRLNRPGIAAFRAWVTHHFRLVKRYKGGKELWVRV